jgi:hypothetical protein
MTSKAQQALTAAVADVDALIADHAVVTGGGVGKPAGGKGAELARAGVVLLAGAVEGFVEDLFDEAVDLIYQQRTPAELKAFKKETSGRLNNVDSRKTNLLFSHIGLPWALEGVRWQKFSNDSFVRSLDSLVLMRNKIAHGRAPARVLLNDLRAWRTMAGQFSLRFEWIVADHVATLTGVAPPWR